MKTLTSLGSCLFACALCSDWASAAVNNRYYNTGYDCAVTAIDIEKLICRDPQLARMNLEMIRLYRLALTDQRSQPPPEKIVTDQRFWLLARDQCANAIYPKVCTIERYAERAFELRRGSAIVRTKDPDRLTEGPVAFRCNGQHAPITATYFNAGPNVVYLKWADTSITLSQVSSETGTRYSNQGNEDNYSFWQNGGQAMLNRPGSPSVICNVEPMG